MQVSALSRSSALCDPAAQHKKPQARPNKRSHVKASRPMYSTPHISGLATRTPNPMRGLNTSATALTPAIRPPFLDVVQLPLSSITVDAITSRFVDSSSTSSFARARCAWRAPRHFFVHFRGCCCVVSQVLFETRGTFTAAWGVLKRRSWRGSGLSATSCLPAFRLGLVEARGRQRRP